MQDDVKRRSGPFHGDGHTTDFPFGFYVFSNNDVRVETSDADSVSTTVLVNGVDYIVTLNSDQDATPGGTVKLVRALATGKSLAITSDLAYTQEMQLTNFSRFPPEILNDALDRTVILIQQLKELASRHLTVPSTSDKTPSQVLTEIFDIADQATDYLAQTKALYEQTFNIGQSVENNAELVEQMKESVEQSEQNVVTAADFVNQHADELNAVYENVDALEAIGPNKNALLAIANDLQGYPIVEFDGGFITEPDEPMNGLGGVLKTCSDNIEAIRKVADLVENVVELYNVVEAVDEIGATDYVKINETGNTGA